MDKMSNIELKKFDEQVDKYLSGQMSEQEEKAFKEELEGSQEKKERAAFIAMTIKAIHEIHEHDAKILDEFKNMTKDDLEQLIADVAGEDESESKGRGVAACIALGTEPEDKVVIKNMTKDDLELLIASVTSEDESESKGRGVAACIASDTEPEDKVVIKRMPYLRYAAVFVAIVIMIGIGFRYNAYNTDVKTGNDKLAYTEYTAKMRVVTSRGVETASTEKYLDTLFNKVRDGSDLKETTKQLEILYEKALSEDEDYIIYADKIALNLAFANLKKGHGRKAKKYLRDIIQRGQNADAAQELMGRIKSVVF